MFNEKRKEEEEKKTVEFRLRFVSQMNVSFSFTTMNEIENETKRIINRYS